MNSYGSLFLGITPVEPYLFAIDSQLIIDFLESLGDTLDEVFCVEYWTSFWFIGYVIVGYIGVDGTLLEW